MKGIAVWADDNILPTLEFFEDNDSAEEYFEDLTEFESCVIKYPFEIKEYSDLDTLIKEIVNDF